MDELDNLSEEILAHIKSANLRTISGRFFKGENVNQLDYDDWKSCIDAAKDEVRNVVVSKEYGKGEHQNDIATITVTWIKGDVVHTFMKRAEWSEREELAELESRLDETIKNSTVAAEIREKSEEDLANEALEFIKAQIGESPVQHEYLLMKSFWESKGLQFVSDPSLEQKKRSVDSIVKQKLKEKQLAREEGMMPELVDKCASWITKKGLPKLTKDRLLDYLEANGLQLSRTSQDSLCKQVNIKLSVDRSEM
jgi:hypothetical protein